MSHLEAYEPVCTARYDAIELLIKPRSRDLGGFMVRRVLPAAERMTVGPFIFFDEMGPADFPPGEGINVRPHPHIGLATVTFLFEGEILHRDSLGFVQVIRPGAVNLMTAGRGIVHSERTDPALQQTGQRLHGIQTWIALPDHRQDIEPDFQHFAASSLPIIEDDGTIITIIIGDAAGERSPVPMHATTLYLDIRLSKGAAAALPDSVTERAIYVVAGEVVVGDCVLKPGTMAVIRPGAALMTATESSHVMLAGGETIGPRHIWWNFVHTSRRRIEQAKRDWRNDAFDKVPDDDEFIPLPEK